jgi:hypothetical protein
MQTNIKFNNITFFTPVYRERAKSIQNHCFVVYYVKGTKRKTNQTELNLYHLYKNEKLAWKYVKIGVDGDSLIIMEGTKENGYHVLSNYSISNNALVNELFKFFNYRLPNKPNDAVKISLQYEKIDTNIFKLKKI